MASAHETSSSLSSDPASLCERKFSSVYTSEVEHPFPTIELREGQELIIFVDNRDPNSRHYFLASRQGLDKERPTSTVGFLLTKVTAAMDENGRASSFSAEDFAILRTGDVMKLERQDPPVDDGSGGFRVVALPFSVIEYAWQFDHLRDKWLAPEQPDPLDIETLLLDFEAAELHAFS